MFSNEFQYKPLTENVVALSFPESLPRVHTLSIENESFTLRSHHSLVETPLDILKTALWVDLCEPTAHEVALFSLFFVDCYILVCLRWKSCGPSFHSTHWRRKIVFSPPRGTNSRAFLPTRLLAQVSPLRLIAFFVCVLMFIFCEWDGITMNWKTNGTQGGLITIMFACVLFCTYHRFLFFLSF